MPVVPVAKLVELQSKTNSIRNISIVAHVDHGKTTLSDSLISSNGVFSSRNAGKIRYMDFTEEEQRRGITMKAASISLMHTVNNENFLINLIDSPGHVDFTTEVSSALRVTDGCIVVVDAVEGVCIQTRVVLRQAWNEGVKPVLLVNKIDKLLSKLNLDEDEAYVHIKKLLTSVNEVTSGLSHEGTVSRDSSTTTTTTSTSTSTSTTGVVQNENAADFTLVEDDGEYFSPSKGNVVFGSALGGWGFSIQDFVKIYSEKLGISSEVLNLTLWGDYYLVPKTKQIFKNKPTGKSTVPMFATFVLKPIWQVFQALLPERNEEQVQKIVKSLKLEISARELSTNNQPSDVLASILATWLPIAPRVLDMVVKCLPSPLEAQKLRIPLLWKPQIYSGVALTPDADKVESRDYTHRHIFHHNNQHEESRDVKSEEIKPTSPLSEIQELPEVTVDPTALSSVQKRIYDAMISCNPNEDVVVFISKVFAVPNELLLGIRLPGQPITAEEAALDRKGLSFIGMARIFSGTIKPGQTVHVLGPKYNPLKPSKHRTTITVKSLYLLMGRNLESISEAPAGNIFGISGIEGHVFKTATLSSLTACASFDQMKQYAAPIVRVAIEPENSADLPKLRDGLRKLNMADPGCEIFIQKTGEHIVAASGELHLKRCLNDLRTIYANINITESAPLVSFKETISKELSRELTEGQTEVVTCKTKDESCVFSLLAVPLPLNVTQFLEQNRSRLEVFLRAKKTAGNIKDTFFSQFRADLEAEFEKAGKLWRKKIDKIWAFGPNRSGPNMLINSISDYSESEFWTGILSPTHPKEIPQILPGTSEEDLATINRIKTLNSIDNAIVTGFSLAAEAGPLCLEPMVGVCFEILSIEINTSVNRDVLYENFGPLSGQVIASVKSACSDAFLRRSPRLVEALYDCHIQVFGSDNKGKVYGVISRRRGKPQSEDVKEGSEVYAVTAQIPVAESFGFADELFTKTSGYASGQLVFSHWEIIDQDPNFVPQTKEELEQSGYNVVALGNNIAKIYVDNVRKRKGLPIKKKLVEKADKQPTLSRKR